MDSNLHRQVDIDLLTFNVYGGRNAELFLKAFAKVLNIIKAGFEGCLADAVFS
jgi:hypothetical protein